MSIVSIKNELDSLTKLDWSVGDGVATALGLNGTRFWKLEREKSGQWSAWLCQSLCKVGTLREVADAIYRREQQPPLRTVNPFLADQLRGESSFEN